MPGGAEPLDRPFFAVLDCQLEQVIARLRGTRAEVGGFLDVLEPAGVEVIPTVAANAVSSGPVTRATFNHVRDALLERLASAGPVDGVLLALHGAMVLEDAA